MFDLRSTPPTSGNVALTTCSLYECYTWDLPYKHQGTWPWQRAHCMHATPHIYPHQHQATWPWQRVHCMHVTLEIYPTNIRQRGPDNMFTVCMLHLKSTPTNVRLHGPDNVFIVCMLHLCLIKLTHTLEISITASVYMLFMGVQFSFFVNTYAKMFK